MAATSNPGSQEIQHEPPKKVDEGVRRATRWTIAGIIVPAVGLVVFGTGFYVIQPIGAMPEGATIWFVRPGTGLGFIGSADGMLLAKTGSVSLLGRAMALGQGVDIVLDRKIATLPYMRTLYLISTGGKEFGE